MTRTGTVRTTLGIPPPEATSASMNADRSPSTEQSVNDSSNWSTVTRSRLCRRQSVSQLGDGRIVGRRDALPLRG